MSLFALFKQPVPRLEAIFTCAAAGEPMQPQSVIRVIAGEGLQGDRYQTRQGYWDPVEGCQVTLITQHELGHAAKKSPVDLSGGQHRRNLVVSSVRPAQLANKTFRIGTALFRYARPRPPCGYLDQLVGRGTAKALGRHSGCCITVLESGEIRTGDTLELLKD